MAQACVMSRPRQEQQQQLFTPGKQAPPLSPQLDSSLITSAVRKRKVVPPESPHPAPAPPVPAEEGKRQRTPSLDSGGLSDADVSDAVVRLHLQLVSPAAALKHAAATPASSGGVGTMMDAEETGDAEQQQQEARPQQPAGPWQHPHGQHQQHGGQQQGRRAPSPAAEEEDVLFSPVFHLCREGSRDDLAAGAGGHHGAAKTQQAQAQHQQRHPHHHSADLPPLPPAARQQHAAQAQQQPPAASGGRADTDNTSTDHSTGTSACLASDADISDADDAEEGREQGGAAAREQQQAQRAQAQQQQGDEASAYVAGQEGAEEEEGCEDAAAAAAAAATGEYIEFDPLLFIKRLPPLDCCVPPRREFLLPKKTRRSKLKTLVLDLDETLVHSTLDGYCRPDFTFPVEVGSMTHMVSVRQRPDLHTFLERVAQLYEVVVFTASQRVYAEQLLNIVDPQRRLVRHRVYRESCVFWEGNYLKDLTVLGRDLAHTIIIDNSPQAFGFQIDNGIPIESWYDDDQDEELLKLLPFLERMAHSEDVRPHIQKRFRLRHLVESAADPEAYLFQQQQQLLQQQDEQQQQQAEQQPQSPPPPPQQHCQQPPAQQV